MENEEARQEEEIEIRGRRTLERQETSVCATIAHTLLALE